MCCLRLAVALVGLEGQTHDTSTRTRACEAVRVHMNINTNRDTSVARAALVGETARAADGLVAQICLVQMKEVLLSRLQWFATTQTLASCHDDARMTPYCNDGLRAQTSLYCRSEALKAQCISCCSSLSRRCPGMCLACIALKACDADSCTIAAGGMMRMLSATTPALILEVVPVIVHEPLALVQHVQASLRSRQTPFTC